MRLLADESLRRAIVRGVLRRCPAADFVRVQDVGLRGKADPDVLEWAAANNRIVVTQDYATFHEFAYERVAEGKPMPGVFVVGDRLAAGIAIDELALVIECSNPSEWVGRVVYLPL